MPGEGVAPVDAGIVDQDRDRPDLLGDAPGDRDAIFALADVELETFSPAARAANFLRRLLGGLLVQVEQCYLRALVCVTLRDRASDPGRRTRDDGDMVLEKRHGCFLCFSILAEDSKGADAIARPSSGRRTAHTPS
jgi:hypothetical protein